MTQGVDGEAVAAIKPSDSMPDVPDESVQDANDVQAERATWAAG